MKEGDGPAVGDLFGKVFNILKGDEHDDGFRVSLGEPPGGFEPIHLGHVDVHQNEIRMVMVCITESLRAGCGISDRLKAAGRIYHGSSDPAKSRLVIDDHNSDADGSVHLHGDLHPGGAFNVAPPAADANRAI
jgi:hypothetical protein